MDMDRYIGRLLDNRYEILEVIGIGGMAVVYKARCHRLNRLVAIKILKDEYSQDEEFRNRFHAESQAVAMLGHPNIVSVYDVSTTGAADYIVMELIDGISLKQYMEKKGVLNWKETLHFGIQIAKALEHAHSRGVIHRDIKPHNIMVLKNGSVKVADFGIARLMSKGNTLTKEALGSVHYISPEQAKGGRVDNRSDLYSLGVVMYEMMAGRPPYDGESPVSVAIQHINGGAPMPSTLNPNIPGGLEQIIMKAMALDPNARYDSATKMLEDMEEFRKNPAMLFDYGMGSGADIHIVQPTEPKRPVQPRTTAERVAGVSGIRRAAETAPTEPPLRGTESDTRQKRRQRHMEETEENRSRRIATVAIVTCSAVAVIAIVIFLMSLFSNGMMTKNAYVSLPNLKGAYYDEVKDLEDLEVVLSDRTYSSTYEKGRIISQLPEFEGQQVAVNTKIYVVVSMGPEPEEEIMEDLTELKEENAKNFLIGQGVDEKDILVREESSQTVAEGLVIRTDPTAGTVLEKGQTVTIWVSKGLDVVTAKMPNVLGKDISMALKMLNAAGFKNVETEEVESEKAKGIVISQSEEKNTDVDVAKTIYLEYSAGAATKQLVMPSVEGQNLSTAIGVLKATGFTGEIRYEPVTSNKAKDTVVHQSIPEGFLVDATVEIVLQYAEGAEETTAPSGGDQSGDDTQEPLPYILKLPTDMTEPYMLRLKRNGVDVVDPLLVQPTETEVAVALRGSGVETFQMYVNDTFYSDVKVDLTPYG